MKKRTPPQLADVMADNKIEWLAPRASYKDTKNKGEIIPCCVLMMDKVDALIAPLRVGPSLDWVPRRWLTFEDNKDKE